MLKKLPLTRTTVIAAVSVGLMLLVSAIYFFMFRKPVDDFNPGFARYIEGYTSGIISKNGTIKIQLTGGVKTMHTNSEPVDDGILEFTPAIDGKAHWLDERTIEFRPAKSLQPGKEYGVTFKLGKVIEVAQEFSEFHFSFEVIKPSFKLEETGFRSVNSSSLDHLKLSGSISTSDVEDPASVEKILTARVNGMPAKVKWVHNAMAQNYQFTIDSIRMEKQTGKLQLLWDGKPINSDISGSKELEIPAIGVFKVLDIRAVQEPEQYVLVQMSNPVMVAQDLNGLITVGGITDLRFTIDGSEIKVYAPDKLEGSFGVKVNEGIENIIGQKLKESVTANVSFENMEPSVTIPGKGMIIPDAGKLTYPFEAVNLNAVDVTIIKIFENNIPQFFQANSMDGDQDLRRVGKPILQKTIRLDSDKSLNLKKKNRFALDIDQLIKTEPGAIYRITIGFKRAYSLYNCTQETAGDSGNNEEEYNDSYEDYYSEKIDEDDVFWQEYNSYYPRGFNWEEKDNPCSFSYYNKERWASRNVIASNIGLIAKRGNNGSVTVVATDVISTDPMSGVEIRLLNYQNQLLQTATTDQDGIAHFDMKLKPHLLIANKGGQKGYLKLDDGSSLPLSRFNVSGDAVQNGIKGFIYGERGVWRPGDSIFVSFILEDKEKSLPTDLPVIFELYTPQGQLNKKLIKNKGLNGFYSFHVKTENGSPTGNWLAKIRVGGAVFSKSIKVETIMPNRLKINFSFRDNELGAGKSNNGTLSARWLFGATAKNLKASVDATLVPSKTTFKNFDRYVFDDPTSSFQPESKKILDGMLNDNGTVTVNASLSAAESAPGVLRANFLTKVFEPGGNFSIDNFSMPYHIYDSYAGVRLPEGDKLSGMLMVDRDHTIDIANVNTAGILLKGQQRLQVELYKIQWRWWWDDGQENLTNFTQNQYNQLLKKEIITLNDGKGKWTLRLNSPDWGRYLIRVKDLKSGHTTGQTLYADWPGWQQREQQNNPTEASMLSFTSNREKYRVGEEVTLTIPSSKGGRGLVSIESGSRVLKTWWIETQQGQTVYKFKVEKDMAPNVYVNVTLLQPHSQTANDLPIRMYGLIPILVEDPQTILKPVISIPAVIKPETTTSLSVRESSGKAMTYTIAIVDDGLLDLTRFTTPDPHKSFYAREALGVKTWDLFDQIVGAWGGDLMRILSIGGDANINRNVDPAKANRFKPVVKYMGPYTLKAGGTANHSFKLPQYIGSVRAMVVAGHEGAYGYAEKTVEVKKPLMLLATLPRTAGPGETFRLPVTVFAMNKDMRHVSLEIQTNNLLSTTVSKQSLTFDAVGEKMAFADIKVKEALGIARVKIIARSGNEQAVYDVEMDIRNPNPHITAIDVAEIPAGKSWSGTFGQIGIAGTNSGQLEISSVPAMNLTKRLNYLIRYPHGCVEQVTSAVFPQLMLDQLTDLTESQKAQVDRNVKVAISKLRAFQAPGGGLAYWPGLQQADDWGTNYAGHFLLEAQNRGYSLPVGMLDQWKKHQKSQANSYAPSSSNFYGGDLIQAYRLYLLALAKSPEIGAMNRLREFPYLSTASKWRLAAAYKIIGQEGVASKLISGLSTAVEPYQQMTYTYGSDLRDEAMILETLTEMGRQSQASALLKSVAAKLSKDNWYSTQTTAFSLIAIAKYCGVNRKTAKMDFVYTINQNSSTVSSKTSFQRFDVPFKNGKSGISVKNTGNGMLYVRVVREGQPPQGVNPPQKNNKDLLNMKVVYKTLNGKLVNPEILSQGTDFVAEVTINNPGKRGNYDQMALTQIFPSGWEIINTRLSDTSGENSSSPYTYRDIRDDRVLTYFNIKGGQTLTYQVLLNASYLGRYYLPSVSCAAMYDDEIQAVNPGKWVQVVK